MTTSLYIGKTNLLEYLTPKWVHQTRTEYRFYNGSIKYAEFSLPGALTTESIRDWNVQLESLTFKNFMSTMPLFNKTLPHKKRIGLLVQVYIYHKSHSWRLLFY